MLKKLLGLLLMFLFMGILPGAAVACGVCGTDGSPSSAVLEFTGDADPIGDGGLSFGTEATAAMEKGGSIAPLLVMAMPFGDEEKNNDSIVASIDDPTDITYLPDILG